MKVAWVSVMLALCCRGTTQIISADDFDHVSLLQTQVHRRSAKEEADEPDLNALQEQLNKLQRKVATVSHVHEAEEERKSMMMVDLRSTTPENEIKSHKDKMKSHKTKADRPEKKEKAKKQPKPDKFAKASLAKADKAEKMERSAMASIMDDEAGELADDESHVLSAGALDRLEQVAERVAQSEDQDEGWQDVKFDEKRHDQRHDEHKSKNGKDKINRKSKTNEENDGDDLADPEAELVRLAHQRAKREEAKAQLAEGAAKDAWVELEKFQAQRNVESFPTGALAASSAPQGGPVQNHKKRQGR